MKSWKVLGVLDSQFYNSLSDKVSCEGHIEEGLSRIKGAS